MTASVIPKPRRKRSDHLGPNTVICHFIHYLQEPSHYCHLDKHTTEMDALKDEKNRCLLNLEPFAGIYTVLLMHVWHC